MALGDPFPIGTPYPATLTGQPNSIPVLNSSGGYTFPGSVTAANLMASAYGPGTGGVVEYLSLTDAVNGNGTFLTTTGGNTSFGVAHTAGTMLYLLSGNASNSTTAPVVCWEYNLPLGYAAGSNLTINVNAQANYTGNYSGITTHTLQMQAYPVYGNNTEGAIIGNATGNFTSGNTATALTYTVTGTSLVPGSRVMLVFTGALTSNAAGNTTNIQINSVGVN